MSNNSFGQNIKKISSSSEPSDSFKSTNNSNNNSNNVDSRNMIYYNDSENMNDTVIEKTFHHLLAESNDHLVKSGPLDHHQQSKCPDNNDNNCINQGTGMVTNGKNIPADFESIIERAILSMDSNQILINEKKTLNSNFTNNMPNNEEKPFILENILSDEHNPTISFDLDDLNFPDTITHDFSNYNSISNSNITFTDTTTSSSSINCKNHDGNNLKRKIDDIDIDFEEFEKLTKSAKINIKNSNEQPPFLSPASLSPSSSLSADNNESKSNELEEGKDKNKTNQNSDNSTNLHKNIHNKNNNIDSDIVHKISNDLLKSNKRTPNASKNNSYGKNKYMLNSTTKSVSSVQPFVPEKLTNEYTINQISEMKKRIINTHKLLLNFNFLKDSYAKTCIELKKSLNALRDSEIHRAHLLLENETLKAKLLELKSAKNEKS